MRFEVNLDLIKQRGVLQRPVEFTHKHSLEVDNLFAMVIKQDMQCV